MAIGWTIILLGILVARHGKEFLLGDPLWFHLHRSGWAAAGAGLWLWGVCTPGLPETSARRWDLMLRPGPWPQPCARARSAGECRYWAWRAR